MVDVTGLSYDPPDLELPPGDLWVFGYGSLMWDPAMEFAEVRRGRTKLYARSFCLWDVGGRGSLDRPGLMLAIDAYDQPAVETGKKATFGLMGRAGFEDWQQRVDSALAPSDRVIKG